MPELFSGSTIEFVDQASTNRIAETLRHAFFREYGFQPTDSEYRSWDISLRAFADTVRVGRFDDHGLFLEYQLPLSSLRLDAMITGIGHAGSDGAVIVELKQWDDRWSPIEPAEGEGLIGVRFGPTVRDHAHPSAQVRQYRRYLEDSHTSFHEGAVGLAACSYLHGFLYDQDSELLSSRHAEILSDCPLFAKDRQDDLIDFLDYRVGRGKGLPVLRRIREGRYQPHKKLLHHVAAMIRQEPAYVLLDAQYVVFNSIVARAKAACALGARTVFVVRGGPGTGKSVLAVNLVAALSASGLNTHHATGSRAFTETIRKIVGPRASSQFKYFNSYRDARNDAIDVLVCDEAHRIREHSWDRWTRKRAPDPERLQIDELLSVAKVAVFFIDDMQGVRRNEIGRSVDIETAAREGDATLHTYDLEIQFRCGGSAGFVRWVENTFGIRRTANALWTGDERFEFRIVDSPEELDRLVRAKVVGGDSARLAAGYCWDWSDPRPDGTLEDDVRLGTWSRPWNARPDAGRLAKGIPKSHLWASEPGGLDQVGCIYTAQGFEFDYVGVIFGNDLVYRWGRGWVGQKDVSRDNGLKRGTDPDAFTALVKNTYRVLLTRGLKGCFIHFMDEETRHFVESRIESYPQEEGFGAALVADKP